MENRTHKQVDDIVDYVKSIWSLSILEEDNLESLLYLIKDRDTNRLNEVETLLDGRYNDLVDYLPGYVIDDVICDSGFINKEDESGLVSALEDLNYDFLDNVSEEELEQDGYFREKCENLDLLTSMQMDEMKELFLKLDSMEREEILEGLRW